MKLTASILALLILFLSTGMAFNNGYMAAADNSKAENCCTRKKSCHKMPEKKTAPEGCKGMCNPFMVCSGCLYLITEKPVFHLPILPIKSVKAGMQHNSYTSPYQADCWHPPRQC